MPRALHKPGTYGSCASQQADIGKALDHLAIGVAPLLKWNIIGATETRLHSYFLCIFLQMERMQDEISNYKYMIVIDCQDL